jgi:hypothetical protein
VVEKISAVVVDTWRWRRLATGISRDDCDLRSQ